MKFEVVRNLEYYPDGLTLFSHIVGEVIEIEEPFATNFEKLGYVTPISDRETKPLRGKVEIKGNNSTRKRTRKPRRPQGQSSDH